MSEQDSGHFAFHRSDIDDPRAFNVVMVRCWKHAEITEIRSISDCNVPIIKTLLDVKYLSIRKGEQMKEGNIPKYTNW